MESPVGPVTTSVATRPPLMGTASIEGARRGKKVRTTGRTWPPPHPRDLVGRDFTATAPNQLWVVDLTFVATWAGMAYVFPHRRLQPYDRGLAGCFEYAHHHGARRD